MLNDSRRILTFSFSPPAAGPAGAIYYGWSPLDSVAGRAYEDGQLAPGDALEIERRHVRIHLRRRGARRDRRQVRHHAYGEIGGEGDRGHFTCGDYPETTVEYLNGACPLLHAWIHLERVPI